MKKRFVSIVLIITMVLAASLNVFAAEIRTSGTINGIEWVYNSSTKTLTFSGKGELTNYDNIWGNFRDTYIKEIKSVVVGEGITKIGQYSHMYLNDDLNPSVSLPLSLTYIDSTFLSFSRKVTVYYPGTPEMWEKIENHSDNPSLWNMVYGMEKTADLDEYFNPININGSFDNFKEINKYTEGQFTDVKSSDWFSPFVAATFRKGLFAGTSATTFNPQGNLSNAEAIVLAVALRRTYADDRSSIGAGTPWYKPYVEYAVENGIVGSSYKGYENAKMNSPISRLDFARIFIKALPKDTYVQLSNIKESQIPDMCNDSANQVIPLYNSGIISGRDGYGTFAPTSNIKRCEVAVIVSNMADKTARKAVTLQSKPNIVDSQIQGVWRYRNASNTSAIDEYSFSNGAYTRASSEGNRFFETGTYRINGNKLVLVGERITGDKGGFTNQTTTTEGYELLINNIVSGGMSATYSYDSASNSKWFMKAKTDYLITPYNGAINSKFNLYSDNLGKNDLTGYATQDLSYLYGSLVDKASFKLLGCYAGVAATTLAHDCVVTVIVYNARNVLGVEQTESYVSYYDLYSGQTIHNVVKYYEDEAKSYAGASKLRVMSAQTQALSFAANTLKMEMIPSSLLTNAGPYVATSKWKIDAYFNSNAQSTARLSSISKFNPVICHYALSGGKKSESITVHMAVLYPDGTFYSGIRDEKLVSGDTGWVGWENSIYADPAYGSAGTLTLYFYDENGALIGSASITITD